ncbi:hypothetical protein A3Q56_00095 [Intoshia linei]|uniref:Uncharacterized protein n=1 Tax=Intoshia linei TaxID=1819745 RepID=A0A177BF93_9BILA|nr:hypothetical protein A3Q56_00095 [Intoshia linei]
MQPDILGYKFVKDVQSIYYQNQGRYRADRKAPKIECEHDLTNTLLVLKKRGNLRNDYEEC